MIMPLVHTIQALPGLNSTRTSYKVVSAMDSFAFDPNHLQHSRNYTSRVCVTLDIRVTASPRRLPSDGNRGDRLLKMSSLERNEYLWEAGVAIREVPGLIVAPRVVRPRLRCWAFPRISVELFLRLDPVSSPLPTDGTSRKISSREKHTSLPRTSFRSSLPQK